MDKEKSGLREEDNIEKDGLQEENSDNDVYDGLDDFVEYDDLASLEGLPQLDELDGMDDLSALPEVAASIKMDDSEFNEAGNNDNVDMTIDIPLPDVGITFKFLGCYCSGVTKHMCKILALIVNSLCIISYVYTYKFIIIFLDCRNSLIIYILSNCNRKIFLIPVYKNRISYIKNFNCHFIIILI